MSASELFAKHAGESGRFDLVENKRSDRSDLHAFIRLGEWFPHGTRRVVSAVGDEVLQLFPRPWQIETLTEDQIIELIRCGVTYDNGTLYIF